MCLSGVYNVLNYRCICVYFGVCNNFYDEGGDLNADVVLGC